MVVMRNMDYNKNLKERARVLRKNSTHAEIRLWCELLRAKQMLGYKFLRQRPIGLYIVDFFNKDLKLIVEVDGSSHDSRSLQDFERDRKLEKMGYSILRFTNEEILFDLVNVKEKIMDRILALEQSPL